MSKNIEDMNDHEFTVYLHSRNFGSDFEILTVNICLNFLYSHSIHVGREHFRSSSSSKYESFLNGCLLEENFFNTTTLHLSSDASDWLEKYKWLVGNWNEVLILSENINAYKLAIQSLYMKAEDRFFLLIEEITKFIKENKNPYKNLAFVPPYEIEQTTESLTPLFIIFEILLDIFSREKMTGQYKLNKRFGSTR